MRGGARREAWSVERRGKIRNREIGNPERPWDHGTMDYGTIGLADHGTTGHGAVA